jgi:hypothetical protein
MFPSLRDGYLDFLRPVMIYQLVRAKQPHEGALFTIDDRQIDQVRSFMSMQSCTCLQKEFHPRLRLSGASFASKPVRLGP